MANNTRIPHPTNASAAEIEEGKGLYAAYCSVCHGVGAKSGGLIPDLRKTDDGRRALFQQIVREGALRPLGMPAFADSLDATQVERIKAYVMTREFEDYNAAQQTAKTAQ